MILLVSDDKKGSGGIKKNCSSLNPEKFVKQEGLGWFSPHSSYSSAQINHSSITNLLELLLRILPVDYFCRSRLGHRTNGVRLILHLFLVWSRSRFWTPNKLVLMLFFIGYMCTGDQFRKWMRFFFSMQKIAPDVSSRKEKYELVMWFHIFCSETEFQTIGMKLLKAHLKKTQWFVFECKC